MKKIIPILIVGVLVFSGIGLAADGQQSSSMPSKQSTMSVVPSSESLSMQKHVLTEKPLADCSMVGDSGLSLATVMVEGGTWGDNWYGIDNKFTISYESNEIASIYYGIDENWTEYSEPFTVSSGRDHILEWYAVDYEGNHSEVDGPFQFKVDRIPPCGPYRMNWLVNQGPPEPWILTFWVECIDVFTGMDRVDWSLNDVIQETDEGPGPLYEWTIEWSSSFYSDAITFKATAYDKAGNSAFVDIKGNEILLPGMVEKDSEQNTQTNVSATERVGIEKESSKKKPRSGCSSMDGFELSSLVVVVNREMGNNDWVVSDVNITMIPDDITAVYYKVDDGGWMLYTSPLVISDDGEHKFSWYVVDDDGNPSTPDSISFKIDQTQPDAELSSEKIGIFKTKFIANVSDETSDIERVEFRDGDYNFLESIDYDSPYEWTWKSWRKKKMKAVAFDNAGNSAISNKVTTQYSHSLPSSQQSSFIPSSQNVMSVVPSSETVDIEKNEINDVNDVNDNALSDQDLAELEKILINWEDRFYSVKTQDERIAILKEIPVVSDKYGLLPEDMTVEETQELIVSAHLETIASGGRQSDKQSKVAGDSPLAVSKSVVPSALPQLQVSKSNRINNIKLNPPQPAEWPLYSECVRFGFGWTSNLTREFNGDEYYWSFNCEDVICCLGVCGAARHWHHYTNGEIVYLYCPYLWKVFKGNFIIVLL